MEKLLSPPKQPERILKLRRSSWQVVWLVVGSSAAAIAAAQTPTSVPYEIRKGDTLVSIAGQRFEDPRQWRELAKTIPFSERRLPIGQVIQLPKALLKASASQARVLAVAGQVSLDGRPLRTGDAVGVGSWIVSETNSSATLELADKSVITIGPASRSRFEVLRFFHDPELLEVRLHVEKGRAEAASAPNRPKPFEIRTPAATAAVRGTVFRASADTSGATTEVLEGGVTWQGSAGKAVGPQRRTAPSVLSSAVMVKQDFGAAASPAGVAQTPETLLPPPQTLSDNKVVLSDQVIAALPITAVSGASAYRLRVARDPHFTDLVQEQVSSTLPTQWASTGDGTFHIGVRAIAPSRVEGKDVQLALNVNARPVAPQPVPSPAGSSLTGPSVVLAWLARDQAGGAEVREYELRWSQDQAMQNPTTLRTAATRHQLSMPLTGASSAVLPNTRIFWQVAAVDKTGKLGAPSAVQELHWWGAPRPAKVVSANQTLQARWDSLPGTVYRVQLADNPSFAAARIEQSDTGRVDFTELRPGQYFLRLEARLPNGQWGPSSQAVSATIVAPPPPPAPPPAVSNSSNEPWQTGSGLPLGRPH